LAGRAVKVAADCADRMSEPSTEQRREEAIITSISLNTNNKIRHARVKCNALFRCLVTIVQSVDIHGWRDIMPQRSITPAKPNHRAGLAFVTPEPGGVTFRAPHRPVGLTIVTKRISDKIPRGEMSHLCMKKKQKIKSIKSIR